MNFAFIIDNSLSMSQITCNNISLLEIAKNGVEYLVKSRLKNPEVKNDSFYLFTTDQSNKGAPLSWLIHDYQHFFYQLRSIKQSISTDLSETIGHTYQQLNYLRFFNGSDSYYGGRDIYKLDLSAIIIFTDNSDFEDFQNIEKSILERKYNFRWDQQLSIFKLCIPGIIDKGPSDSESFRKTIHMHPSNQFYQYVTQYLNGSFVLIETYYQFFHRLDQLSQTFQPQVGFLLEAVTLSNFNGAKWFMPTDLQNDIIQQHICNNSPIPGYFFNKTVKEESSVLPNGSNNSTNQPFILRGFPQYYPNYSYYQNQGEPNHGYVSQVMVPQQNPSIQEIFNNKFPNLPKLFVDFTQKYTGQFVNNFPFQTIPVEQQNLCIFLSSVRGNVKEKLYFPILSSFQEGSPLFLVGLLKFSNNQPEGTSPTLQLLFYMWNFIDLNCFCQEVKKSNLNQTQLETMLENYLKTMPYYYLACLQRFFCDRGYERYINNGKKIKCAEQEHELAEMIQGYNIFLNHTKQLQKQLDDEVYKQKSLHNQRQSVCCAPYSKDYEEFTKKDRYVPQNEPSDVQHIQLMHRSLLDIIFKKKEDLFERDPLRGFDPFWSNTPQAIPAYQISEANQSHRIQEFRNPKFDQNFDVQFIKEPQPLGNPFKLFYRSRTPNIPNSSNQPQQPSSLDDSSIEEANLNSNLHQNSNQLIPAGQTQIIKRRDLLKQSSSLNLSSYSINSSQNSFNNGMNQNISSSSSSSSISHTTRQSSPSITYNPPQSQNENYENQDIYDPLESVDKIYDQFELRDNESEQRDERQEDEEEEEIQKDSFNEISGYRMDLEYNISMGSNAYQLPKDDAEYDPFANDLSNSGEEIKKLGIVFNPQYENYFYQSRQQVQNQQDYRDVIITPNLINSQNIQNELLIDSLKQFFEDLIELLNLGDLPAFYSSIKDKLSSYEISSNQQIKQFIQQRVDQLAILYKINKLKKE